MTRAKKSRGSGQIGVRHKPAAEARLSRERPVETKKKGSGLKSGSRNSPEQSNTQPTGNSNARKDPRHGSKKPIPLVLDVAEQKLLQQDVNFTPKAQLTKAKAPVLSPEQELAQLEQDERLLALVDRVEQGEILTGKDAKYFNSKTARHAELLDLLGLAEDDEPADEPADDDPLSRLEKTDWRKELLGE